MPTTISIGRDKPGDDSTANTADAVEQKRGSGRPDQPKCDYVLRVWENRTYSCISYDCRSGNTRKRWCANCKSATHDTAYCRRKKDTVNKMLDTCDNMDKCNDNECHSFVFRVSVSDHVDVCSNVKTDRLLVHCGATAHIINDRSKYVKFHDEFDSV